MARDATSKEHKALEVWRDRAVTPQDSKARKALQLIRRGLLWLMMLPLICIASIPAFGYVLATNIPADSHWWQSILSEPMVIALLQVAFNAILMPPIINQLAIIDLNPCKLRRHQATILKIF